MMVGDPRKMSIHSHPVTRKFLLFAIFHLIINHICPVSGQIILAPSKLYMGKYPNKLLAISNVNKDAILRVLFEGRKEPIYEDGILFHKNSIQEINIPGLENQPKQETLQLKLIPMDNYDQAITKKFSTVSGLVYFQTDKPIYRTSDTVRFRALCLDPGLFPVMDSCNLTIRNHQNVKLEVAKLSLKPPYYFADYSFQLPLMTKKGIWSAELQCGNNVADKLNFEVRDYELPMIKIDMKTPDFQLCNSSSPFEIQLNATYIYGKPIQGYVYFRVGLRRGAEFNLLFTTPLFCLENGFIHKVFEEFSNSHFCEKAYVFPQTISVEAIVTDSQTNAKERFTSNHTKLTNCPYTLSMEQSTLYYKTNLANYITCQVVDLNGNPKSGVRVDLNITNRRDERINPYVISDQVTDENGIVVYTFKINRLMGKLKVKSWIDDGQCKIWAANSYMMYPYDEDKEQTTIMISNRKKIYYDAGTRFHSSIVRNGPVGQLYWVVSSKGAIFKYGKVDSEMIEFILENSMAPTVRILVIGFESGTGKLIADSIRIYVKQKNCFTDIEVMPNRVGTLTFNPGSNITFLLRGAKNDVMALNAVDEAIYVLRNKKNVTRKNFENGMLDRDLGNGSGGGKNSLDVIKKAGFEIINLDEENRSRPIHKRETSSINQILQTECQDLMTEPCCWLAAHFKSAHWDEIASIIKKYNDRKLVASNCSKIFSHCRQCLDDRSRYQFSSTDNISPTVSLNGPSRKQEQLDDDQTEIRSDFRDSWLFDLVLLDTSTKKYTVAAPHSITSWIVSSLSVSNDHGFCMNNDQRLTTFKPFFIHLSMPQYVVLREQTEIKATVFNYLNEDIAIDLWFYGTKGICSEFQTIKYDFPLKVAANSSETKSLAIVPIQVGVFPIKVKAVSYNYRDTIIKNLTVIFPGVTKESFISLDLDPSNRAKRGTITQNHKVNGMVTNTIRPDNSLQKISIKLNETDDNIIPETVRHKLSFMGRRFNPTVKSIEELEGLIKKPKGCGEQNMYYMAFNLYTLAYLKQIGELKNTLEIRGINYLKRAFRQQLFFRKSDGSFSAFDNRDSSIWLTAFITKIFCRADPFLSDVMDRRVVTEAVKWLRSTQSYDGSWNERYQILHQEAQGGSNQGSNTLTAYIFIALNECHSFMEKAEPESEWQRKHLNEKPIWVEKANDFLLRQIETVQDSYTLSIMTHALLFDTLKIPVIREKYVEQKLMFHSDIRIDSDQQYAYYNNSYSVETTSYALLALTKARKHQTRLAKAFSNWLLSQQTDGAFDNTQNTIVALEALTAYHAAISSQIGSNEHTLYANVSFNSRHKREIKFNNDNYDLLHTIDVDKNTHEIEINTIGNGFGRMELLTVYNVYQPNDICYFEFQVNISNSRSLLYTENIIDPDSIFAEFPPEMREELKNKKERSTKQQSICSTNNRKKRSFWSSIMQRLKKTSNPRPNETSKISDKPKTDFIQNDSRRQQNQCIGLPPLNLDIENPLVRIINICLRRLISESGMVIMDFTVLSGYLPVNDDLEELKRSGVIEFYENIKSKIIFYFRDIPNGRNLCLCFRIYQREIIQNTQAALVQVYDYYRKGSTCSRSYTDVDIPEYIGYQCRAKENSLKENHPQFSVNPYGEACKCVVNKKCPNNDWIDLILDRIDKDSILDANQEFRHAIEENSLVVIGRVGHQVKSSVDPKQALSKIYLFKIDKIIYEKNRRNRKEIKLRINSECDNVITENDTNSSELILLIMVDDEIETIPVLDSRSIFYRPSKLGSEKKDRLKDLLYSYDQSLDYALLKSF